VAVAEQRDEFPNNFVGDLVPTERGWVVVPPTCCPHRNAYTDPGLVSEFGVVHMQWAAYGVALLVRRIGLRATTGAALPNPRHRTGIHVGRRATRLIGPPLPLRGRSDPHLGLLV
jgi:hypothetical protein